MEVNFRQNLPGGHCFTCHKDYTEESEKHPCFTVENNKPTECTDACKDSKYQLEPWMRAMFYTKGVDN